MGLTADQGMALMNQAIQGAQGIALQSRGINKQIKGQGKIMAMQAKHAKELSDYQQEQQLETWKATSYPGQMEQLKNAGLNAGLMYGMGGGGGVTTGASMQTGVSGGNINTDIPTFGLQLQQQQAQIELIKAQTANINANTEKTGGVDTKKTEAEITNLGALTENTKAKTTFTELQNDYQRLENTIKEKTLDKAIARIEWEADDTFEKLQKDVRENNIGEELYTKAVETYKAQYIKLITETTYIKQQTEASKTGQKLTEAETTATNTERDMNIKRTVGNLETKWAELGINDRGKVTESNEYKELTSMVGAVAASAILQIITKGKTTPIKGFMSK